MEDGRVWEFEQSLWIGDADQYEKLIDPRMPDGSAEQKYVFTGGMAIEAVQ